MCSSPPFPWPFSGSLPFSEGLSTLFASRESSSRGVEAMQNSSQCCLGGSPEERPCLLSVSIPRNMVTCFIQPQIFIILFANTSLVWWAVSSDSLAGQAVCWSSSCVLSQGCNTCLASCTFTQADVMVFMRKRLMSLSLHDAANWKWW